MLIARIIDVPVLRRTVIQVLSGKESWDPMGTITGFYREFEEVCPESPKRDVRCVYLKDITALSGGRQIIPGKYRLYFFLKSLLGNSGSFLLNIVFLDFLKTFMDSRILAD